MSDNVVSKTPLLRVEAFIISGRYIYSAVSKVKQTQLEQAEAIQENLENISQKCVSDIKEAGMSTVGAIADANSETLNQVLALRQVATHSYTFVSTAIPPIPLISITLPRFSLENFLHLSK